MSSPNRVAQKEDFAAIKEVIDASFPRFYRYFAWHSILDRNEPTLIYQADKAVAGFAKLITFHVNDSKFGCILWIAVHPQFRYRGVASALTHASLEHLRADGVRAVFASTQRGNVGALAILEGVGFVRIGFLELCRLFGLGVFGFFRSVWFAPGEVVLISSMYF